MEQADSEPEDQSGDRSVFLVDVCDFTVNRVRKMRYVDEQTWFPDQREMDAYPFFHTLLQESFYFGYLQLGIQMSEHRMLHWGALRVAAGRGGVCPFSLSLRDSLACQRS